ncbi:hypothetical protein H4R19_001104 [Coemansia spiralis]|nr:hypothetical protein H4R19_001104 [Coemansia spiralis]
MKLTILSVGLLAMSALAAPITQNNKAAIEIDTKCAFRITYQLIGYLNTGLIDGAEAECDAQTGAGYAAGIGKFSTKSGNALAVVDQYIASPEYKGEFKDVHDALAKAATEHSVSTDGLSGFCPAWEKAAKSGDSFHMAQVTVIRGSYEKPMLTLAKALKIKFPLTRAALLSTALANGLGDAQAGLGAVIAATNALFTHSVKGTSGNRVTIGKFKVDEIVWLGKFLDTLDTLSAGVDTRTAEVFRDIIATGSYKLDSTTVFQGFDGKQVTLTCKKLTDPAGGNNGNGNGNNGNGNNGGHKCHKLSPSSVAL